MVLLLKHSWIGMRQNRFLLEIDFVLHRGESAAGSLMYPLKPGAGESIVGRGNRPHRVWHE